jgi:hypothetical protein
MEDKEVPSKEESRLINLILSNGARFYVDHAHPEYSSPETTNPRDCVIWDRAGERILDLSRTRAEAVSPPEQRILIYKNNTDSKGNSYGTHENYLMDRKARARWGPRTTPSSAISRSPSAPTSWRPRSGWRRCTAGPSSIPGTSRTPIPRSIAACT